MLRPTTSRSGVTIPALSIARATAHWCLQGRYRGGRRGSSHGCAQRRAAGRRTCSNGSPHWLWDLGRRGTYARSRTRRRLRTFRRPRHLQAAWPRVATTTEGGQGSGYKRHRPRRRPSAQQLRSRAGRSVSARTPALKSCQTGGLWRQYVSCRWRSTASGVARAAPSPGTATPASAAPASGLGPGPGHTSWPGTRGGTGVGPQVALCPGGAQGNAAREAAGH